MSQDHTLERLSRIYYTEPSVAPSPTTRALSFGATEDEALRREWSAPPPGRLGRRLLVDIELYLDFFATARS
jgi:hypothetical protein